MAAGSGGVIGALGTLIGPGGAEFRLLVLKLALGLIPIASSVKVFATRH